jgi:uncharacterized protein (TIGR04255 family)
MLKLPTEIRPSPLVTTTVEVRFLPHQSDIDLLQVVYPKFMSELPILTQSEIPKEIKQQEKNLRYSPDYTLKNNDYSLSFSHYVLAFENVSNYKLWPNYYDFISRHFNSFFDLNIIKTVKRIGVRYGSIFNGTGSLDEIIDSAPTMQLGDYKTINVGRIFRTNLLVDDINLHLQLADNAKARKEDKHFSGAFIDIDASITKDMNDRNEILRKIDLLHHEQKKLFFSLLRSDFVAKLNPTYS